MNAQEIITPFLNNVFDEAVLAGSTKAVLTATVVRSLRVAVGVEYFDILVHQLEASGKVKWLGKLEMIDNNTPVIEITDYVS
ncbi:MAG: hypothetical protein OJI67_18800 [Prosthecobacter sp.]|nr:hypothetical protein [Prosthecobacter sp.]